MDLQVKDGWIEVIAGSMYAGKTEELLRRVRRIQFAKKKVLILNPKLIIVIVQTKSFRTITAELNLSILKLRKKSIRIVLLNFPMRLLSMKFNFRAK